MKKTGVTLIILLLAFFIGISSFRVYQIVVKPLPMIKKIIGNNVVKKTTYGKESTVKSGMYLGPRDVICTGENTFVEVEFYTGHTIVVQPNSSEIYIND